MNTKHPPLVADKEHVRFEDGSLLATIWEKYPSKDQLPGESWLEMMDRTAADRATSKQDAIDRARLFAAAPDLLEALKDALTLLWPSTDEHQKALAAIAKATGEQA